LVLKFYMTPKIDKLISIASESILPQMPEQKATILKLAGTLADELYNLLLRKNGFFAFESALHVFPLGISTSRNVIDLETWNNSHLWRKGYDEMASKGLFFAEDIFGSQFCIIDSTIHLFDPETGGTEEIAADIESWADALLRDFEFLTGYPIAHDWQSLNGALPPDKRLLPKIPFVLGGEFSINNLYASDSVQGMRVRADMALQIRNLPDGGKVQLKIQ
jgi:hypothetical protein